MSTQPPPPPNFPKITGRCPACGSESLFLAHGGCVTCSRAECPDPGAATDLLEASFRRVERISVERIWGPGDTYVAIGDQQVWGARPGQTFARWESKWEPTDG